MRSPHSSSPARRLSWTGGRFIYRFVRPEGEMTRGMAREVAFVVSPAALRIRRLIIYRRVAPPPLWPDGTPTAA